MNSKFSLESSRLTANEAKPFDPKTEVPPTFSDKGLFYRSVSGKAVHQSGDLNLALNEIRKKEASKSSKAKNECSGPSQMC